MHPRRLVIPINIADAIGRLDDVQGVSRWLGHRGQIWLNESEQSVFDNDAEGIDTFRTLQRFTFPVNMRAMVLPDLEELRNFPARGPGGVACADINGRAAAIECYLYLSLKD